MRVWSREPGSTQAIAQVGIAIGYVQGRGISVALEEGQVWVELLEQAWEWIPPHEEDRPAGLVNMHGIDTRQRGWMEGRHVRVWLPNPAGGQSTPRVGKLVDYHPRRGVRVRLADSTMWLGNAHMWQWVDQSEAIPADATATAAEPARGRSAPQPRKHTFDSRLR